MFSKLEETTYREFIAKFDEVEDVCMQWNGA